MNTATRRYIDTCRRLLVRSLMVQRGGYRYVGYDQVQQVPKAERPTCGAKTRRGTPCQARAVIGMTRCRLHGGYSTGPTTDAGRAAIAASNRRRAVIRELKKRGLWGGQEVSENGSPGSPETRRTEEHGL